MISELGNGIIKLDDIVIGRSVGAKAPNYSVMDLDTGEYFKFVEGTKIQNPEVFADKGTNKELKIAEKYANKYGRLPKIGSMLKTMAFLRLKMAIEKQKFIGCNVKEDTATEKVKTIFRKGIMTKKQ